MATFPIPVPVIFVEVTPLSLLEVDATRADHDGRRDVDEIDDDDDDDTFDSDGRGSDQSDKPPVLTNFSVHQYLMRRQNDDDDDDGDDATATRQRQRCQRRHGRPRQWYFNFRSTMEEGDNNDNIIINNNNTENRSTGNEDSQDRNQQHIILGYLQLDNDNDDSSSNRFGSDHQENKSDHQSSLALLPIVRIPSDDPLQIKPVPCIVRAYIHRNHVDNNFASSSSLALSHPLPATIVPSTLVRIRSPSAALPSLQSSLSSSSSSQLRSLPPQPPWIEKSNFLNNELLGEGGLPSLVSPHDDNPDEANDNHDIIRCFDARVVDELTLKLRRVGSRTIRIGTTQDALMYRRRQQQQLDRLRRCCSDRFQSLESNSKEPQTPGPSSSSPRSWWWPPSLVVHSRNNCDGKTLLVRTLLRQRLSCDRVHVVRAGPILAKYGTRADAALESQIHTAVVSAACRRWDQSGKGDENGSVPSSSEPPSCAIVLDQLESFLPPRLSGKTSGSSSSTSGGGDPSVAVVNAIASYLRNITSTMQRYSEFPFPMKNPLYNNNDNSLSSSGGGGQVLPVRIFLVGIVTCPDDGWRASSQITMSSSSGGGTGGMDGGGTIFNAMGVGGDIFRLPLLTDLGRFLALQSFLKSTGLRLNGDDAVAKLETLAASYQWVKAGIFQKLASRLVQIVNKKETKTKLVETTDLEEAFEYVRLEHFGISTSPSPSPLSGKDGKSIDATTNENQTIDSRAAHFASVGGAVKAKAALEDALALDPRKRKLLKRFGLRPPSGVLLYGPPGTGKTLLAKAVADLLYQGVGSNHEGSSPPRSSVGRGGKFISLNISDVVSSEVGTSEKTLVTTFEYADQNTPAVIFLDEFQALFTDRDSGGSGRLTTTLLQCLDDIHRWREADEDVKQEQQKKVETDTISRVTVIAATNTPWMIDSAFLRSGRFDRVVKVGLPTMLERESIFMVQARRMRIRTEDNDKDDTANSCDTNLHSLAMFVARETDGYSGADLAGLCRAAAVRALISDGPNAYVTRDHFSLALSSGDVCASSDEELILRLESWRPGRTAARQSGRNTK